MSKDAYFAQKGISASLLKQYAKSPRKAQLSLTTEMKPTEALILGSCFHEMMENKQTFVVFNEDYRPEPTKTFASKLNKEWKQEFFANNDLVITQSQYGELLDMVQSVKQSQFYRGLQTTRLESIEGGYYFDFPEYRAKCKPDALFNGADGSIVCVDWKTTNETLTGSKSQIEWLIRKLGYDIQAVHYTETLKNVFQKDVNFFFVFVEKSEPYEVIPVWINPKGDYYDEAFIKWQQLFSDCAYSLTNDEWNTIESKLENNLITL